MVEIEIPEKLAPLFEPHPYKVLYGGRDGVKRLSVARALLILGSQKPLRIPCGRETMDSIRESVHQLAERPDRRNGGWTTSTMPCSRRFGASTGLSSYSPACASRRSARSNLTRQSTYVGSKRRVW